MNESLKILILEDDAGLNELIRRRLAREGHECFCFQRAEGVLKWLSENSADMIILDLMLPDYSGEELISILKRNNISIPFIVATGQGSEAMAVKLLKKGAKDYLVKNSNFLDALPAAIEMVWREIQLESLLDKARQQISIQNATLSAVFEFSPQGILVMDNMGKILSVNNSLLAFSGGKGNFKSGLEFFRHIAGQIENGDEFIKKVTEISDDAKGLIIENLSFLNKSFDVFSSPMFGENIENCGRIWYFRDITIHKKARRAMELAKIEAEKNAEMKSKFFALVSHDVKTPLGAIKGFVELLDQTTLDSTQREYTDIIKSSSEHLICLIDDILDLTRIEHGEIEFNFQAFSIRDLLKSCLDTFAPKSKESGVELLLETDENVPEIVYCDLHRAKQIILNLVGNAMKFTHEGSVTLKCSAQDEKTLLIQVADTGIGINEEAQKHIFAPFLQAGAKVRDEYGGYGLGLAIAKQLVEKFGGQMSLTSTAGKGSVFSFTLPVNNKDSQ